VTLQVGGGGLYFRHAHPAERSRQKQNNYDRQQWQPTTKVVRLIPPHFKEIPALESTLAS